MVREGKKKEDEAEMEERKRLKKLAFRNNIISDTPTTLPYYLSPSKLVMKHNGKDIIRKSHRSGKNRFIFSFPGLLAPISGGKIGELKDLGTKNPILYLDFPQGQVKLFGTIVFPKNRYLTLQFSRGGKNVMCEDYFDNMIVFSEAWWIGKKDENPNEERLEFPKAVTVEHEEYDFKGGAGATCQLNQFGREPQRRFAGKQSPKHEVEDDFPVIHISSQGNAETTPTRHSARTAGKTSKFAGASSGDDIMEVPTESSEGEDEKIDPGTCPKGSSTSVSEKGKKTAKSGSKSKELAHGNQGPLVQATISTLFKKAGEKIAETSWKKMREDVGVSPRKKAKGINHIEPGIEQSRGKKATKVEEDDIEEFSSSSEDIQSSDSDWKA